MADGVSLPLLIGMAALGFRHGFDWDHIAAITDITSTTSASHGDLQVPPGAPLSARGHGDHSTAHEHAHQNGPGALQMIASKWSAANEDR